VTDLFVFENVAKSSAETNCECPVYNELCVIHNVNEELLDVWLFGYWHIVSADSQKLQLDREVGCCLAYSGAIL
jgi:hypothetical protein